MGWIASSGFQGAWLAPETFDTLAPHDPTLLTRGTLMMEAELPRSSRPDVLLDLLQDGPWPARLGFARQGEGNISLLAAQGRAEMAAELTLPGSVLCAGLVRISYAWDAPSKWGRLAIDLPDIGRVVVVQTPPPAPMRLADLAHFTSTPEAARRHVGVNWFAFADHIAPVGPMPGLSPQALIATPRGYQPAKDLRTGDTVVTAQGEVVPILHRVQATVPALSSFRPVRLKAPFAGLKRDTIVSAHQRVLVGGSEVEYTFGQEAALVPAGLLLASGAAVAEPARALIPYVQLVLPGNEALVVAGLAIDSLNVGRLHRNKGALASSLMSQCPRNLLPEHAPSPLPVLDAAQVRALMVSGKVAAAVGF